MTALGALLRGLRLGKNLELPEMAFTLGTTRRRYELIENGAKFPPAGERREWASRLGFPDLLEFDRQWRDGWARLTRASRQGWIPIINKAPAGHPTDYHEYGIDSGIGFEYVPRFVGMDEPILFAVVIIGQSMRPAYGEGDLVIFRPTKPEEILPDGTPVFIRFSAERDHGCTFKSIYRRDDGRLELRPENREFTALVVMPQEIDRMAVAIERLAKFWTPKGERMVHDQYAQEFPED